MSIDAWYHGDRKVEGKELYSRELFHMRDGLINTAVDMRRAVDFLQSRSGEVDPDKISYFGGSMGGIIGALFTGMDTRVKAPVLIVGGADWSYLISHSIVAQVGLRLTPAEGASMAKDAKVVLAPADPLNTAQLIAPRPLLMLNAKHDILVNPVSNVKLFRQALPPKKIIWFDSGHGVPINDALKICLDWFNEYVKNSSTPTFTSSIEGYNTAPYEPTGKVYVQSPISDIPIDEYFGYDKSSPLLSSRQPVDSVNLDYDTFSITFQSTHDRMVNATLNIPSTGSAPFPCVIFAHDINGSPNDSSLLTSVLARNGIATVSFAMYGYKTGESNDLNGLRIGPYGTRNILVQTVQDMQRLMDMLNNLEDIVAQSYIVVGSGLGADASIVASGLDDRIRAIVAMNALEYKDLLENGKPSENDADSVYKQMRFSEKIMSPLYPVMPELFLKRIWPRPLLFVDTKPEKDKKSSYARKLFMSYDNPSELYSLSAKTDDMATNIGDLQRRLIVFIKAAMKSKQQQRKIETTENRKTKGNDKNSAKDTKQTKIIKITMKDGLITATVGPFDRKILPNSIVSEISYKDGRQRTLQLNQKEIKADEGEIILYQGFIPEMTGISAIKAGGLDLNGEPIIEKSIKIEE